MNWTKAYTTVRNISWILMASTLFYLWYFISPQYITYKEEKEKFEIVVEKIELEKEILIKELDSRKLFSDSITTENKTLTNKLSIVRNNLNHFKDEAKLLKQRRENFEVKDTMTNEELEIYLIDSFYGR